MPDRDRDRRKDQFVIPTPLPVPTPPPGPALGRPEPSEMDIGVAFEPFARQAAQRRRQKSRDLALAQQRWMGPGAGRGTFERREWPEAPFFDPHLLAAAGMIPVPERRVDTEEGPTAGQITGLGPPPPPSPPADDEDEDGGLLTDKALMDMIRGGLEGGGFALLNDPKSYDKAGNLTTLAQGLLQLWQTNQQNRLGRESAERQRQQDIQLELLRLLPTFMDPNFLLAARMAGGGALPESLGRLDFLNLPSIQGAIESGEAVEAPFRSIPTPEYLEQLVPQELGPLTTLLAFAGYPVGDLFRQAEAGRPTAPPVTTRR